MERSSKALEMMREALRRADPWTVLFWALLCIATGLIIAPLWIGKIPFLTDFGGHLSVIDIWVKIGKNPVFSEWFERRNDLSPALCLARAAWLMSPVFETITSVRIFFSAAVLGTVASLLWLLKIFHRSRWQIFCTLPFVWGSMLTLGLLNYVSSIPFMFLAVGFARRAGTEGRWTHALGLALSCLGAYLMHGIGFVFTVAMAACMLTISARTWSRLLHHLAFAPACLVWLVWYTTAEGPVRMASKNPLRVFKSGSLFLSPRERLEWYLDNTLDVIQGHEDIALFVALVAIWIVLMAVSARPEAGDSTGGRLRRAWADIQARPLLILVLWIGAGLYFLPTFVAQVAINYRLVTPFTLVLMLLPRTPARGILARAAIAASVVVALLWGQLLVDAQRRFTRKEIEPLASLIEHIPEQRRVECLGVRQIQSISRWNSLDHNCYGLVQHETGSFSGTHFAATWYNAVRFRENKRYVDLNTMNWRDSTLVTSWDYFVVRGKHVAPSETSMELVHRVESPGPDPVSWSLYRVLHPDPPARAEITKRTGGAPASWSCPAGTFLSAVSVLTEPPVVGSVRMFCRGTGVAPDGSIRLQGEETVGLVMGARGGKPTRIECGTGKMPVGIHGRSALQVDKLGIVCATVRVDEEGTVRRVLPGTKFSPAVGGDGGKPFRMLCPDGLVLGGLEGRSWFVMDAVGIRCVEPDTSLEWKPPPRPVPQQDQSAIVPVKLKFGKKNL